MTLTEQPDPAGGQALAALVAALRPFVASAIEALEAEGLQAETPCSVKVYLFPQPLVRVTFENRTQPFDARGLGTTGEAITAAVGAFTEAGLSRLPRSAQGAVTAALAGGQLVVHVDPQFGFATAQLEVPGQQPEHLFTLRTGQAH